MVSQSNATRWLENVTIVHSASRLATETLRLDAVRCAVAERFPRVSGSALGIARTVGESLLVHTEALLDRLLPLDQTRALGDGENEESGGRAVLRVSVPRPLSTEILRDIVVRLSSSATLRVTVLGARSAFTSLQALGTSGAQELLLRAHFAGVMRARRNQLAEGLQAPSTALRTAANRAVELAHSGCELLLDTHVLGRAKRLPGGTLAARFLAFLATSLQQAGSLQQASAGATGIVDRAVSVDTSSPLGLASADYVVLEDAIELLDASAGSRVYQETVVSDGASSSSAGSRIARGSRAVPAAAVTAIEEAPTRATASSCSATVSPRLHHDDSQKRAARDHLRGAAFRSVARAASRERYAIGECDGLTVKDCTVQTEFQMVVRNSFIEFSEDRSEFKANLRHVQSWPGAGAESGLSSFRHVPEPFTLRFMRAQETRTTVQLRNLPPALTRTMLLEKLDAAGFLGRYEFVYMPIDFTRRTALGYATVCLVTSDDARRLIQAFQGMQTWQVPSDLACEARWCEPRQTLQEHIERYRDSPVMHPSVPEEHKPVLFVDGVRASFPLPTRPLRKPRVRHHKGSS